MTLLSPRVLRKKLARYWAVGMIVLLCSGCASLPSDRNEIRSNFPAKMAIAAYGQRQSLANEDHNLTPVTDLRCLLDNNNLPEVDTNRLLSEIDRLDDWGPFTPEQAVEAVRLIKTGQFFADIRSTVRVSAEFFPGIRERIRTRLAGPRRLACLSPAHSTNASVTPDSFSDLLACIYQNPLAGEIADTANILLQNDSIRLAIIVYARANGINLTNQDLDVLRDHALNTENPDLNLLAQHGINRLKEQYGIDEIDQLIENIREKRNLCEA